VRLISAVLGFLVRKLALLGAVVASLFLGYLLVHTLVPALREAEAERERLQRVAAERAALEGELSQLQSASEGVQTDLIASLQTRVELEIVEGQDVVAEKEQEVARLLAEKDEVCGTVESVVDWVWPGPSACDAAERALQVAQDAQATVERNLERARADAAVLADTSLSNEEKLNRLGEGGDQSIVARQVETTQAELDQKRAEETTLREAQGTLEGHVVTLWAQSWRWLLAIALLIILLPPLLRTVNYFVLMPLVRRMHTPINLAEGADQASASLSVAPAERTLTVHLDPGEVLSARSEHVRPVQGKVRSGLLYDLSSPFISFAAGLYGLSRVTGVEGGTAATLATPDDPDSYLMRIEFEDHPGLVMRPRHVVGVIGAPGLETRWRWGIHALATWQVRYILFTGTGSLIVQGSGDVVATNPGGRPTRMDQHLVMGFDSRLTVGINRTEVFLPYLWRRTPLVDDEFIGDHPLFWQKSNAAGPSNPVARTFDAVFSALGRVLGF
jgi:hypothetical protein